MPFATPSRHVRCSRPPDESGPSRNSASARAASTQSSRSSRRPASASAASISPFHEAIALSSRNGFGRSSRAANSTSRSSSVEPAAQDGAAVLERLQQRVAARPDHGGQLVRRPREGQSLDAVGVGILRRREPAAVERELAQHVLDRRLDDRAIARRPGQHPRVQVRGDEQRVVVEHLLEVRHEPLTVDGVAVEAAADEVAHPAGRHPVERAERELELAAPQAETRRRTRAGTSARARSRPTADRTGSGARRSRRPAAPRSAAPPTAPSRRPVATRRRAPRPAATTSSRRSRYASATAPSTCWNAGMPWRGSGG